MQSHRFSSYPVCADEVALYAEAPRQGLSPTSEAASTG